MFQIFCILSQILDLEILHCLLFLRGAYDHRSNRGHDLWLFPLLVHSLGISPYKQTYKHGQIQVDFANEFCIL